MDTNVIAALLAANVVAMTGIFGILWNVDRSVVKLKTELDALKLHVANCPVRAIWKGSKNVE